MTTKTSKVKLKYVMRTFQIRQREEQAFSSVIYILFVISIILYSFSLKMIQVVSQIRHFFFLFNRGKIHSWLKAIKV